MKKKFFIDNIEIGGETPLIIPEIGINHNGNLQTAIKMVDAAVEAGARLIKHQTHIVDDEMSLEAMKVIPGNSIKSIYEIMKECALSEDEEKELKRYVENKGLVFLSTPFSRAAANRLEKMDVSAYKVGSGEMNNYPLLEHIASFGKPIILSTGMNDIEAVKKAVNILDKKNVSFALLHTTNLYPTPPQLVRLGAMEVLKKEFPNVIVGLSDHTIDNNAAIAALTLGADIIERHFTDTKERRGPDIVCSMDKNELKHLVSAASTIPLMLGGKKEAAKEEKVTIDFAFATVVAIKDISVGETFTTENIWVKRPGIGEIKAEYLKKVIGKTCTENILKDTHISYDMIKEE